MLSLTDLLEGDEAAPTIYGHALEETTVDELPLPHLSHRLGAMREQLESGTGAVRMGGFPSDGLTESGARLLFWTLAVHLGTPVSQSAGGRTDP